MTDSLKQALQTLVEYAKWLQDMSKSLNQGPASLTDEQRDDLFQRASDNTSGALPDWITMGREDDGSVEWYMERFWMQKVNK